MVTYATRLPCSGAGFIQGYRDHKPKLDQSAVSKVTYIWCNEATPPYISLQIKAVRILETKLPDFCGYLFIMFYCINYNSYNI